MPAEVHRQPRPGTGGYFLSTSAGPGVETSLPQTVADNHEVFAPRLIISRLEEPAQMRLNTEHGKKACSDGCAVDSFGNGAGHIAVAAAGKGGHICKASILVPNVDQLRTEAIGTSCIRCACTFREVFQELGIKLC